MSDNSTIRRDFLELFAGNRTAVGTEEGGCLRMDPLWPEGWVFALAHHLKDGGPRAIGVYPMVLNPPMYDLPTGGGEAVVGWGVHWGCVDFDEGEDESWIHAVNLQNVLSVFGVKGWIERSRSKGYHVWVFAKRGYWEPALTVRKGLLAACQIVDAPTKEINPKSVALADGQLGNYVRLPYPGWLSEGMSKVPDVRRRSVVSAHASDVPIPLAGFLGAAHAAAGLDGLTQLAELYQEPKKLGRIITDDERESVEVDEALLTRMSALARHIFEEGPLPDADRSGTLFKLAAKLYEDGRHSFGEVVALVTAADSAWGKFWKRHDAEQRIHDIVEKVWI